MVDDIVVSDEMIEEPVALPSEPTAHPLYHEIEILTSQGNWQAARPLIVELLTLYPDDKYLKRLADTANARSALLGVRQEAAIIPDISSPKSRAVKIIITGLIIFIVMLCLIAGAVLSWWLILPQVANQRQEAHITQLRQTAQDALISGDYDRAVLTYNELLESVPNDRQAREGLEQTTQLRALVSIYSDAIAEMEAHHWDNALALLQRIEEKQPGYRDVAARIDFIQEQQNLSSLFNEAEAAFKQSEYELAIQKYGDLQSLNSGFQHDTVQDHLFLSYLQQGLADQTAAGSNRQQLQTALEKFEKALTLHPNDSQTRGAAQLLSLYLAGTEDFEAENWPQAITNLTPVFEARPDFAGGAVSQFLYDAYLAWGDELFADEQYEQALAKYEEARLIKGVDASELDQKIVLANEVLATPTPEPTEEVALAATPVQASAASAAAPPPPTPTATPQPLPYELKGMSVRNNCSGFGYIHGVIWNIYNLPVAGITVQAFNTSTGGGPLVANPTNGDGIYQIILNADQIEGLWIVQVLNENGQPVSQPWGQRLGGECVNGAQELKVDWLYTAAQSP